MTDEQTPMNTDANPQDISDLPGRYERWRTKTHQWIAQRSREDVADGILLLPDLAALAMRLVQDARTPLFFKGQLVLVLTYVFLPIDFIPEAVLGAAGLADDVVIISVMLMRILQSANELPKELIQEHWSGRGDLTETLTDILDNEDGLINTKVWNAVRRLFGDTPPEPAMVDTTPSDTNTP